MKLLIERYPHSKKETIGSGFVLENDFIKYEFLTLELPWKDNKKRVSCIPIGEYPVVKRWSKKFGDHFHILDVPNRDYILIHKGNYHTDILGCILPGDDLDDINDDNEVDVINSTKTLNKLLKMLPDSFTLKIVNI